MLHFFYCSVPEPLGIAQREAILALHSVARRDRNNPRHWFALGIFLFQMQLLDKSKKYFGHMLRAATTGTADWNTACLWQAVIEHYSEKFDDCELWLDRITDPTQEDIFPLPDYFKAICCLHRRDTDQAKIALEKIPTDWEDYESHVNYLWGLYYGLTFQWEKARPLWEIRKDELRGMDLYSMGVIYKNTGDPVLAKEQFLKLAMHLLAITDYPDPVAYTKAQKVREKLSELGGSDQIIALLEAKEEELLPTKLRSIGEAPFAVAYFRIRDRITTVS